ncbi:MAG TPA: SDR family oxidoreductase [Acidimicrobiia bacterium]|jgi:NAD(P)-dependent dehydrogenase (short-subunit alcohol dehydrogenase family)|nr:SDR family oxidoreductase [Acidimicrobiia bacterium]
MAAPVALVTGASRGIGRATALALADAGYDVAIAARTVHEGDGRMAPGSVRESQETRAIEGSLDTTAAAIKERGQLALPVAMDLLDRPTIDAMVDTVLGEWGRIDALVNNAIYQGPGRMDRVLELDLEAATKLVVGNYVNQLHLIQLVVPGMLERGGGRIVNMASATASMDPPAPAGEGGWGLGYGASKAAFLRIAGQLHVEFATQGLVAFNVDPGFTTNDKPSDEQFAQRFRGAPPEVTGAAIAWLCSSDEALELAGTLVYSQPLCKRRQLLPGWPPT